nr:hypothetical protein [uncultured Agathobaculum sp.]
MKRTKLPSRRPCISQAGRKKFGFARNTAAIQGRYPLVVIIVTNRMAIFKTLLLSQTAKTPPHFSSFLHK